MNKFKSQFIDYKSVTFQEIYHELLNIIISHEYYLVTLLFPPTSNQEDLGKASSESSCYIFILIELHVI